jgi:hypothetical protein
MNTPRRVEMIFGLLTALSATIIPLTLLNLKFLDELILTLVLYVLPGLLVAIGAHGHARAGKKRGIFILMAGGLILLLLWVPSSLAAFYLYGLWGGSLLVTLHPGVLAAITMIAAWFSRKSITN